MKVLIIPYNYPTIENPNRAVFIKDHKEMLESEGVTVDVLGVIPKTLTDVINSRSLRFLKLSHEKWVLSIFAVKGLHKFNKCLSLFVGKCLLRKYFIECSKNLPDVIHVHNGESAELALWSYEKYGIPYVVTEHSSSLWSEFEKSSNKKLTFLYSHSKANIAVSRKFARHLSSRFGCDFKYIPNSVDTKFFHCSRRGNNKKILRLISVGNLTKNKNHRLAILGVSNLIANGLPVEYTIIGSGPELGSLIKLVDDLGLRKVVTFLGSKSRADIKTLLCASDRFLLPSISETFGVVLIEAMSSGLPVIAMENGGSDSIILNQKVGLLVKDELAFHEQLKMFCENHYCSRNISAFAREHFSISAVAKQYLELYSQVL